MFTQSDNGFHYYYLESEDLPATWPVDWTDPVDYALGHFEVRVELFGTPEGRTFTLQPCIWMHDADGQSSTSDELESCSYQKVRMDEPGLYTVTTAPIVEWWDKNNGRQAIDVSRPHHFKRLGLVLRTADNCYVTPYDVQPSCWDERAAYLPIDFHLTIVAVSAGETFSGWEAYPIEQRYPLVGAWNGYSLSFSEEDVQAPPKVAGSIRRLEADTSGNLKSSYYYEGGGDISGTYPGWSVAENGVIEGTTQGPEGAAIRTTGGYAASRSLIFEESRTMSGSAERILHRGWFVREPATTLRPSEFHGTWEGLFMEATFDTASRDLRTFGFDRYQLTLKENSMADYVLDFSSREEPFPSQTELSWFPFRSKFRMGSRLNAFIGADGDTLLGGAHRPGQPDPDADTFLIDLLLKPPVDLLPEQVIGVWTFMELLHIRHPDEALRMQGGGFNLFLGEDQTYRLAETIEANFPDSGVKELREGTWSVEGPSLLLSSPSQVLRFALNAGGDTAFLAESTGQQGGTFSDRILVGSRMADSGYPSLEYFLDTLHHGGGWIQSAFFGWFNEATWPTIFHDEHGWLHLAAQYPSGGFWFHDTALGWTYTSRNWYPVLYSIERGWYWFLQGTRWNSGSRWMWSFDRASWEAVDQPAPGTNG